MDVMEASLTLGGRNRDKTGHELIRIAGGRAGGVRRRSDAPGAACVDLPVDFQIRGKNSLNSRGHFAL